MLKSSLLKMLRTFSSPELKDFRNFVKSPIYNKKAAVIKFLDVIYRYEPGFNDEKLTKENGWAQTFPGKSYNYGTMKNLIHDLTKLAEMYITYKSFTESTDYDKHLIIGLSRRKALGLTKSKLLKFETSLRSHKQDIFSEYKDEIFSYEIKTNLMGGTTHILPHIETEIKAKIRFFIISMIKCYAHLITQKATLNTEVQLNFLRHILTYIENWPEIFEEEDVLRLYYTALLCILNTGDENLLKKFELQFNKFEKDLNTYDKLNLYSYFILLYEEQNKKGVSKYNGKLLQIFVNLTETDISSAEGNYLDILTLRNGIILSRRNNSPESIERIMKAGLPQVHPKHKVVMTNYSLASLHFLKKDYEKAIEYCAEIELNKLMDDVKDNLYFKSDIKLIQIKSLYELKLFEHVFSAIDAYLHYLRNTNLLPRQFREMRQTFLNSLKQLIKLNMDYDKTELINFEMRVKKEADNGWLLEKIVELKNANK